MFHPYSIQGGTLTADPQLAGMNGHSRIPEMFGNVHAPYSIGFTGSPIPSAIPIAGLHPHSAVGYGYAPMVSPMHHTNMIPQYANPYFATPYNPYAGAISTMPFVTPFQTTPFVNTIPTTAIPGWNTIPASPWVNPFMNAWNPAVTSPIPTTPPNVWQAGYCQTTLIPTPGGYIPVTVPTINPYANNPFAWANYPFRHHYSTSVYPNHATGGVTTPPTGNPIIDAQYAVSAWNHAITSPFTTMNPLAGIGNPSITGFNPLATGCNPFVGSVPWNVTHPSLLNSTIGCGIPSPLNAVGSPFISMANPITSSILGTPSCNPASIWNSQLFSNPVVGASPFVSSPFGGLTTSPFQTNSPMAIPTINPMSGAANPFFSPTNVAYGIPGYSAMPNLTNPVTAAQFGCGPVCCN